MRFRITPLLCLGLLVGQPGLVGADDWSGPGWEITADRLERDNALDLVVATGNVVMVQQVAAGPGKPAGNPRVIKADWIRYDRRQGVVDAKGHASLDSAEEQITAETALLDLNRSTGTLTAATLYFPKEQLYLEGQSVEKTGELTYHLVEGWASKCKPVAGQASPWSFGWQEGEITVDGFAHFRHATFRVKDLPVAYSPFMAFPTNRQRKTGFLLPELSASQREGSGIVLPFFLNLSSAHDLTLYAGEYDRRGAVVGSEFRYRWAEYSQGVVDLDYLNDRTFDTPQEDYKSDGSLRTTPNRYWLRAKADHDFGNLLLGRLDVDLLSDRDYLQEFNLGERGYDESEQRFQRAFGRGFDNKTNPLRTNSLQLSKFWSAMAVNSEMRLVQDPTETPSAAHLWTLPRLNFSGQLPVVARSRESAEKSPWRSLFPEVELSWESEYLRYWRESGVGYHRGHLSPKLEAPIPLTPYLELVAGVGVDQTWYKVDGAPVADPVFSNDLQSRTLGNLQLAASTTWIREFGLNFEEYRSLSHMVRPSLAYTTVTAKEQTEFPNLDDIDRIAGQRLLTYGLDNDFDLFGQGRDGRDLGRKYANLKVFQSYDLREEELPLTGGGEVGKGWLPVDLELTWNPLARYAVTYKTLIGVHGEGVTRYEVNTDLTNRRNDHLAFGYRYGRVHEIDQVNAGVLVNLSKQVLFGSSIAHSLATDQTVEGMVRLLYAPACWNVELKLATSPDDDYRATIVFSLEGIGKVFGLNQTIASPLPTIGG